MKALFILPNLHMGGAERMTLRLLRDLNRRGLEPTLFLIKREGLFLSEVPTDVRVVSTLDGEAQSSRSSRRLLLSKLLKYARDTDVVVGALELGPTYLAYLSGRILNKPAIGWVHTSMGKHLRLFSRWQRIFTRLVYPRLGAVVVVSRGAADSLESIVHIRPERVAIIPLYLDWDSLQTMAAEAVPPWARSILAHPTVVTVGRLVTAKGFDVLIKAHARLRQAGLNHNLLILGEGPARAELERLALSLNVRSSVFIQGFVANPHAIVKAASIFVLSSRYEGFPLALLEALGVGAATLATDCAGGVREILENGKFGVLVTPEDDCALASAISKLLADLSLRNALRAAAPQRARAFTPENSLQRWERLLSDARAPS